MTNKKKKGWLPNQPNNENEHGQSSLSEFDENDVVVDGTGGYAIATLNYTCLSVGCNFFKVVSHSFHIHLEAKYTLACHGVKFSSGKKFWVPMNFLFWELERRVDILVALACKLKEGWFGPLTRLILCEWVNKQAEFTISVDASKRFNILLWDRMHFDERENIQEVRAGQIVVVSGIDRNLGDTVTDGSVRCIITGVIFKEGGY